MSKLDWYIGKTILGTTALALLLVLGIDFIFNLVNELRYVGTGDYGIPEMLSYMILTTPERIYQMFPMAALMGSLMGLGVLASHSELIILRSIGLSIGQIIKIVLKTALFLSLVAWCFGEMVAPHAERLAQNQKAYAMSSGQALRTSKGIWLRDGNNFVHVRSMQVNGHLEGITRYEFNQHMHLIRSSFAESADYIEEKREWVVYGIQQTEFNPEVITESPIVHKISTQVWKSVISPEVIRVVGVKVLEKLSLEGLWQTIQYRKSNKLSSERYQLAFWTKIFEPLAIMVMMFLAIPFVFGPLRSSSMGLKIVMGIFVGFLFHTSNSLLGPLSIVYHIPAVIAASLPILLFLGVGVWMLKRTF